MPFISNIKLKHPESKIIILCKKWVGSVYLNHPDIDDLIVIPTGENSGIVNTFSNGLSLRNLNIDVFYTLTDSFRSSIIMWLSGAIKRIGFNVQGRGLFLTHKPELPPKKVHRSLKYLRLINRTKFDSNGEFIFFTEKELLWGKNEIKIILSLKLYLPHNEVILTSLLFLTICSASLDSFFEPKIN